tara:strand:+ start:233 stop:448 length:216 start_codon:yes stop_codon:yes gene_type:complete
MIALSLDNFKRSVDNMTSKADKILHNLFSNDVVLIMEEKQKNSTLSTKNALDILKKLSLSELVERIEYKEI